MFHPLEAWEDELLEISSDINQLDKKNSYFVRVFCVTMRMTHPHRYHGSPLSAGSCYGNQLLPVLRSKSTLHVMGVVVATISTPTTYISHVSSYVTVVRRWGFILPECDRTCTEIKLIGRFLTDHQQEKNYRPT